MRARARRAARGVARARATATASARAPAWPRTVADAARALDARALTAVDLLSHCARRVDADALTSRAFVGSAASRGAHARRALADARASDARRAGGAATGTGDGDARRGARALDGVPFAAKDNLCANVGTTSAGSRILEGYESPIEATAIARLRALGGVLIGKTNMDEFGMGSHTRTSGQTTLNPTSSDGERSSGGSSGGSAAAVVNGSAFYALGSDTGGSVRLPAAYCGAVGLKPTYGRVSRFGLVSYCSSLDTVGVLARTVSDAGVVLAAIQGEDALDATTVARCEDLDAAALECVDETTKAASLKGLRVGVPEEYAVSELTQEVYDAWNETVRAMEALGAEIVRVNMPHTEAALPCYYVLAPAEASSNLARYDGMRYGDLTRDLSREEYLAEEFQSAIAKARSLGFGDEVRRRVTVGAFALSSARAAEYFEKAQKVRRLVSDDFTTVFSGEGGGVDMLLTPSSVSTAPKLSDVEALSPAQTYAADVMTVPASLAGLPAMSMPAGRSRASGLPIGVQMIAPKFRESRLVRVGSTLERAMAGTRSYSSSTSPTDALEERGEAVLRRREELIALISSQGVDIDRVVEANKELSRIEPIAEQYEVVKKLRDEKASLEELVRDAPSGGDSKELAELAREELRAVDIDLPDQELALQLLFLPHDDADDRGAILEVRAGAGGDEAALFAAELFRMYALHARKSGWRFDTLNVSETDGKGVREASAEILAKAYLGG